MQMDAELMRPAGAREELYRREAVESLDDFVKRPRRAACRMVAADGHLFSLIRMDADRLIDEIAVVIGIARDDGEILLFDRSLLELAGEREMNLIGLGHDHHAAGVAVEAVDDARPRRAAGAAQLVEVKLQGAGQRAGPMPLRRMHDHAGRLVDRRQPFVFIQNIERDILGPRGFARDRRQSHADPLAEPQPMRRFGSLAVDFDRGRIDGPAKLHAAMRRELLGQIEIEPQADRFLADDPLEGASVSCSSSISEESSAGGSSSTAGQRGMTKA